MAGQSTLGELFDRNPSELTTEDKLKIREALIARRATWLAEKNAAKASGRKPRLAANATPKKVREIEAQLEAVGEIDFSSIESE